MKKGPAAFLPLLILAACATAPYTGRRQLMLISEGQEVRMGLRAYESMKEKKTIETDPRLVQPLKQVGRAIAAAAEKPEYDWEFTLFRDDRTINAWALPGGKIGFYTGIYPLLKDEAGMAIVMGHEVSHALLRHSGERVSQRLAALGGMVATGIATRGSTKQVAWLIGMGLGTTVGVLLPYSRKQESEADRVGLMLAARAGYDPEAGVHVWQRMALLGESKRPELLSTHPDVERRVKNIRKWLPEAKAIYEQSERQPNRRLPTVGFAAHVE